MVTQDAFLLDGLYLLCHTHFVSAAGQTLCYHPGTVTLRLLVVEVDKVMIVRVDNFKITDVGRRLERTSWIDVSKMLTYNGKIFVRALEHLVEERRVWSTRKSDSSTNSCTTVYNARGATWGGKSLSDSKAMKRLCTRLWLRLECDGTSR